MRHLSIVLFTGLEWEGIQHVQAIRDLARHIDVLVSGPYVQERHLGHGLRGSANQRVYIFSDRYTMTDIETVPVAEAVIGSADTWYSGVSPLAS
jgi:hypothetical protein